MKILDFFDRAYAINLPHRKDRYQMIVRELEKAGMSLEPNKVEVFPAIQPSEAERFSSTAVRGCFLSHLGILKLAKQEGLRNVLIMEDDVAIAPEFRTNQNLLVEQLQQRDWGFVYFGHGHQQQLESTSAVALQSFSEPIITAHFYGVNGAIFDRLILFLEEMQQRPWDHPDGGPMPIDGAYSTFRTHYSIPTQIASPSLGWQQSSRSDLSPSWFDDLPVIRQLANTARAVKRALAA
ncbi:MAG: glycosyltransferase family 25 protein [Cyanosarcina radialis HA8281-LM2]|jgi:hypothetical protein|nr:glycosyltransferase family 25 protein [Cyanosarcina radialis HA8281-LM2]